MSRTPKVRNYWRGHRWRPKVPGKGRIQRWPYEQRLTERQWWRLLVVCELAVVVVVFLVFWLTGFWRYS